MNRICCFVAGLFAVSIGLAAAQVDCSPRAGGGYSTYDYGTGEFGTISPRPGGGFSID